MAIFGCQGKTDKWTIRATELINWLYDNKPEEDFVLSHGDFCLPNIFIKNTCYYTDSALVCMVLESTGNGKDT